MGGSVFSEELRPVYRAQSLTEGLARTIQAARDSTGRDKVLWLKDEVSSFSTPENVEIVPMLKPPLLCRAIAESPERIAAIVVSPSTANLLVFKRFLKRVRELASAEGAFLIWEGDWRTIEIDVSGLFPDITCLTTEEAEKPGSVISCRPELAQKVSSWTT